MKRTKLKSILETKKHLSRSSGWMAAGTLAVATLSHPASSFAFSAHAPGASEQTTSPEANLPVRRFSIAPGSLDQALKLYETATGLKVRLTVPANTLAGFRDSRRHRPSPLGRRSGALLAGTGLSYRLDGTSTLVVGLQAKPTRR